MNEKLAKEMYFAGYPIETILKDCKLKKYQMHILTDKWISDIKMIRSITDSKIEQARVMELNLLNLAAYGTNEEYKKHRDVFTKFCAI